MAFLDFSSNQVVGNLPNEISGFSNLFYLDLSYNLLNGIIPSWCFTLPSLEYLRLSDNKFTGPIGEVSSYSTTWRFLCVSNNKLTGGISSSICNVSSLEILNLSHNNFTGTIPQCLSSSSPALSVLDLQMNNFSGTIPRTFEVGNNLETLNLNGNQLEGSLPQSLTNCRVLKVLDVGKNNIEDTFPHWLQTLKELRVLVLRENKFHGSVTNFKAKTNYSFPKLRIFDLSRNSFTGRLPAEYFKYFEAMINVGKVESGLQYMGINSTFKYPYEDSVIVTIKGSNIQLEKILTIFTTIDLSNNKFEGDIPQILGAFGSLKGLNLSHNGLIGFIPKSIGNLRNLEWLDLSSNKLTRKIPVELTNLNFLSFLNLSQNQLEGCIPRGRQFDTFTNASFEGNMELRGFPLSVPCIKNEEEEPLPDSKSGFKLEFGWKPVALGYGCGAAFGAAIGWIVILIEKPLWIVSMVESIPKKNKRRVRNCH